VLPSCGSPFRAGAPALSDCIHVLWYGLCVVCCGLDDVCICAVVWTVCAVVLTIHAVV
jgi:hypothetical protein